MSSKKPVLKHLNGEGPVEILTRTMDFNIQQMESPDGKRVDLPANTLVAFTAQRFRELGDTDEWEFTTVNVAPSGASVTSYVYLSGVDIFMVRAAARVAL